MSLTQSIGGAFTKARALVFGSGSARAFDAASHDSREMLTWTPPLTHGGDEVLTAREPVAKRARDLVRNHPIIAGAVDRRAEAVVGPNIRLEAEPAYEAMGKDADWADEWSTQTETQFELWGRDPRFLCDAQMTHNFGGQIDTAYRHWWVDGEALAVIKMLPAKGPRAGATFMTAVEIVDPDRLSNPHEGADYSVLPNGNTLIGGVEYDGNKAPVAYHIRVSHPAQGTSTADVFRWERVTRFGRTGKPMCVHAFKANRADQRRGISQIVASLKRTKMFDRYDDAEIEAALLNSIMAAAVTSDATTSDVAEALAPGSADTNNPALARMEHRLKHPVRMQGVRTLHLLDGEKFDLHRAEHPSQNYPEFQATGLRAIAANFGLSYAQLAANWADINYSSARAMLNEVWRGLLHDRWLFTQMFCTPIYSAWLEEAVALGVVKVPGRAMNFYKYRAALTMCEWVGPGRGSVDPLKEAQANEYELNMGVTDLGAIGASLGRDPRKTLMRQARDKKRREKLGLGEYVPLKSGGQVAMAEAEGMSAEVTTQQLADEGAGQ